MQRSRSYNHNTGSSCYKAFYGAKRRQVMQKYGVRATQAINLRYEAHAAEVDQTRANVLESINGR